MKLVGICRVFKLEEVSEKCAKGQVYFSTKRGEDEKGNAQFETSFVNARIVGKAKKQLDELAEVMDVEKLKIDITESSFKSVSYQDFFEVPGPNSHTAGSGKPDSQKTLCFPEGPSFCAVH